MAELTPQQVARQDFVDNAVFALLQELAPAGKELEWDISMIAEVREAIFEQFKEHGIYTDEGEFYPYVELNDPNFD